MLSDAEPVDFRYVRNIAFEPMSPLLVELGAELGAAKKGRMAPIFLQATPDGGLRFCDLIGC